MLLNPEEHIIFDLMINFAISLEWLQKSDKLNTKALQDFKAQNKINSVFNESLIPAYAYMMFLFPKETVFADVYDYEEYKKNLDVFKIESSYSEKIDINGKTVTVKPGDDEYEEAKKRSLLRHIRNALAHGLVSVEEENFVLTDVNQKNKIETCKITVDKRAFAIFIQKLFNDSKQRFFEQKKAGTKQQVTL